MDRPQYTVYAGPPPRASGIRPYATDVYGRPAPQPPHEQLPAPRGVYMSEYPLEVQGQTSFMFSAYTYPKSTSSSEHHGPGPPAAISAPAPPHDAYGHGRSSIPLPSLSPPPPIQRRAGAPVWTSHEDLQLRELSGNVLEGRETWADVATTIGTKTPAQCRARYHWYVKKDAIKSHPWTEEEKRLVGESYMELGPNWPEIARRLKGRSTSAVKACWTSLARGAAVARRGQADGTTRVLNAPLYRWQADLTSRPRGAAGHSPDCRCPFHPRVRTGDPQPPPAGPPPSGFGPPPSSSSQPSSPHPPPPGPYPAAFSPYLASSPYPVASSPYPVNSSPVGSSPYRATSDSQPPSPSEAGRGKRPREWQSSEGEGSSGEGPPPPPSPPASSGDAERPEDGPQAEGRRQEEDEGPSREDAPPGGWSRGLVDAVAPSHARPWEDAPAPSGQ